MLDIKRILKIMPLAGLAAAALLLGACTIETQSEASPSLTLSQQQIQERESAMKYYYDTYGDIYAALSLREMFEAGQITQDEYKGAYAQAGDALGKADIKESHKLEGLLNCALTRLSEKDLLKDRLILTEAIKNSPMLISIFDTQQQRDEVEKAVGIIDEWTKTPDDTHTASMEAELQSDGLSCGARVYLYYYLSQASGNVRSVGADGKTYDIAYYLDNRLGGYLSGALSETLRQNNGQKALPAESIG
jgi:hypothetical protein